MFSSRAMAVRVQRSYNNIAASSIQYPVPNDHIAVVNIFAVSMANRIECMVFPLVRKCDAAQIQIIYFSKKRNRHRQHTLIQMENWKTG